jgi:alpha/beta superfamily hydrolase
MKKCLSLCFALASFSLLFCLLGQAQNRLIKAEPLGSLSKEELIQSYGPLVQFSINQYKVLYRTTGVDGKPDTASGLVVFPVVENKPLPLLVYQHGTVDGPKEVPSERSGEAALVNVGASLGYVTLAPDYLGLGESRGFHPYIHAATEASAAIDLLFATRELASQLKYALNGQLYLTGYSQGGHASMALHRELERNYSQSFPVSAAAHMSGPYSVSGETFKRLLSDEPYNYVGYTAWVALSYNQMYKLYNNINQFLKPPYAAMAQRFYRYEIGLGELNKQLIDTLIKRHGSPISRFIFQDSVIANVTTKPNHPFLLAMRDNDVYDWTPRAPTRLLYCKADEQVTFRNSILADSVMRVRGAKDVRAIDVQSNASHGQCVQPAVIQAVFFFAAVQAQITSTRDLPQLPVRMYPNPARQFTRLEGLPSTGHLSLSNLQGQILYHTPLSQSAMDIPLQGLSQGMYTLRVLSNDGVWQGKLLIQ